MRLICVEYAHKQLNIAEIDAGKNFPTDCNHVRDFLNALPVIDAVPVVRCRHCRSHHWEQEPCHGKTVHYCEKLNAEVTADFFCAAGEQKDGGAENE